MISFRHRDKNDFANPRAAEDSSSVPRHSIRRLDFSTRPAPRVSVQPSSPDQDFGLVIMEWFAELADFYWWQRTIL